MNKCPQCKSENIDYPNHSVGEVDAKCVRCGSHIPIEYFENQKMEKLEADNKVLIEALKEIETACPSEWKQDLKSIARQALKQAGVE